MFLDKSRFCHSCNHCDKALKICDPNKNCRAYSDCDIEGILIRSMAESYMSEMRKRIKKYANE